MTLNDLLLVALGIIALISVSSIEKLLRTIIVLLENIRNNQK